MPNFPEDQLRANNQRLDFIYKYGEFPLNMDDQKELINQIEYLNKIVLAILEYGCKNILTIRQAMMREE